MGSGPSHEDILRYIVEQALQAGVPPALALAVAQHESGFQIGALSSVGAIGLFQLMPQTAQGLGVDPHNWKENVQGGVKYLSQLHHTIPSWFDVVAAYGWGPGDYQNPHAQDAAQEVFGIMRDWKDKGIPGNEQQQQHHFADGSVAKFIAIASRQEGDPYSFGAEGPDKFDCSGLIYFAASHAGVNLSRLSADGYFNTLSKVGGKENLQPGDLVFFNYGRKPNGEADHVAIWLGNGKILDTRSSSEPVDIRSMDWNAFIGARRIGSLSGANNTAQVNAAIQGSPVGGGGFGGQGGARVSGAELEGILRGYGLNPNAFGDLIHQAITQSWTPAELTAHLYESDEFTQMFPGIFNPNGSLKMSPAEWQQMVYGQGGYLDISAQYGLHLSREMAGELITNNVSPTEWADRGRIAQLARNNEPYRKAFNKVLEASGQKPLEKSDWFNLVKGRSDVRLENLYEAAQLQVAPHLGISAEASLDVARTLGAPGEQVDIKSVLQKVRDVQDFIKPELQSAGITTADLAVLEGGYDPKGIMPKLNQILRNRQALAGASLQRASLQQGALYPAAHEGL